MATKCTKISEIRILVTHLISLNFEVRLQISQVTPKADRYYFGISQHFWQCDG